MCVCLIALFLGLTIATPIANQYLVVNGPEWLTQGESKIGYNEELRQVPMKSNPHIRLSQWVDVPYEIKTRNTSNLDCACWFFVLTNAAIVACLGILLVSPVPRGVRS